MRRTSTWAITYFASVLVLQPIGAQPAPQAAVSGGLPGSVPRLVKYSGALGLAEPKSGPVGVEFAIYKEESGGVALWSEIQNVEPDATGQYTVLLGATKNGGLAPDVLGSGEARWLAITPLGAAPQPRVRLVSVPYALRAEEALRIAGVPASEIVRKADLSDSVRETIRTLQPQAQTGQAVANVASGPTAFAGKTSTQVVTVKQNGPGKAIVATAASGPGIASTGGTIGVIGTAASAAGSGVQGVSPGTGVSGVATGSNNGSVGVFGNASSATGLVFGVNGSTSSTTGGSSGVIGFEGATTGAVYGVNGSTTSAGNGSAGVFGNEEATSGQVAGVYGTTPSTSNGSAGVYGNESATTGQVNGVSGTTASTANFAAGVNGFASATSGAVFGVTGSTNSSTSGASGVNGYEGASSGGPFYGVSGYAAGTGGIGVFGSAEATSGFAVGVEGATASPSGMAGQFVNVSGSGLVIAGQSGSNFTTVFTVDASGNGYFGGALNVKGNLTKGSGSFKIDDPLDPANKYLSHSFVESPDMMDIYNGVVTLDAHGAAWVDLPAYFEALNRDYRYQLTSIGRPQPKLYIAGEISARRFKIAGGKPGGRVSWMVTGIRYDAYANANRILVEENKPPEEQGRYLHPELFGAPAAQAIGPRAPSTAESAGLSNR